METVTLKMAAPKTSADANGKRFRTYSLGSRSVLENVKNKPVFSNENTINGFGPVRLSGVPNIDFISKTFFISYFYDLPIIASGSNCVLKREGFIAFEFATRKEYFFENFCDLIKNKKSFDKKTASYSSSGIVDELKDFKIMEDEMSEMLCPV